MSEVRLIDADALEKWLATNKANVNPLDYNTKATYAECITMVKAMETIDAEPVRHGRWVKMDTTGRYDGENVWNCSVCGYPVGIWTVGSKYCPNCGAKMDGGTKDG